MADIDQPKGTQRPAPTPAAAAALSAELDGLSGLDLDQLRIQWRNRFGRTAPAYLPRGLLLRLLAYRIQAEVFGDLDRACVRLLDRLARGDRNPKSSGSAPLGRAPTRCKPGTLLAREWNGRMERVVALEQGFAWNGKTYPSLSAVAFAITGTKWNGYRFFGLRERSDRQVGQGRGGKGITKADQPVRGHGPLAPMPEEARP